MSGTNHQPAAGRGGRRPAGLADSQLRHLENMVQHVSREDAGSDVVSFDHEYWEKRIRALEETHDLIASQRHRVSRLLDLLERDARSAVKRRKVARNG